jgi:hypothetical protein
VPMSSLSHARRPYCTIFRTYSAYGVQRAHILPYFVEIYAGSKASPAVIARDLQQKIEQKSVAKTTD